MSIKIIYNKLFVNNWIKRQLHILIQPKL